MQSGAVEPMTQQPYNPAFQQGPPPGAQAGVTVIQPGFHQQQDPLVVHQGGGSVHVVHVQQGPLKREWSTGLCACCHDFKTCCCAIFCMCCLLGQITSRMNECCCVPCIPGGLTAMRTKMRTVYDIQGGICKDHCIMACCGTCAICQMDRELNIMEAQNKFCK